MGVGVCVCVCVCVYVAGRRVGSGLFPGPAGEHVCVCVCVLISHPTPPPLYICNY